jgi:WD40 repeat protein
MSVAAPFFESGEVWISLCPFTATLEDLFRAIKAQKPGGTQAGSCPWSRNSAVRFALPNPQNASKIWDIPPETQLRSLCWAQSEDISLEVEPADHEGKVTVLLHRSVDMSFGAARLKERQRSDAGVVSASSISSDGRALSVRNAMVHIRLWWDETSQSPQSPMNGFKADDEPDDGNGCTTHDVGTSSATAEARSIVQGENEQPPTGSATDSQTRLDNQDHEGRVPNEHSSGTGTWEQIFPHYRPHMLPGTSQARQFEFHPTLSRILLVGNKGGGVNVVQAEQDAIQWEPLQLDNCPVLGLSWMKHHPELAVCGAAHSGKISFVRFNHDAPERSCALEPVGVVESFPDLSSMSVNCTDDFLLVSGFTHDLSLYDVQTGKILNKIHGAHAHFINVSRFAHQSPHIFATASFDHTCKVWDLRRPLNHSHPVQSLPTDGLNVMVTFSPNDRYLLSSGIDTRITQWELPSFRQAPSFPLRAPMHQARYRRSMYLADSTRFVSAATGESHLRVLSTSGKNLGVVDFSGFLTGSRTEPRSIAHHGSPRNTDSVLTSSEGSSQSLPQRTRTRTSPFSRLMQTLRSDIEQASQRFWWSRGVRRAQAVNTNTSSSRLDLDHTQSNSVSRTANKIISGKVWVGGEDNLDLESEYVHSIRAHPQFENRVGVLLSSYHPSPKLCIAMLDLVPSSDSL